MIYKANFAADRCQDVNVKGFSYPCGKDISFSVETTSDPAAILRTCRQVITAPPSKTSLLSAADLQPGTHITAVGSDTPDKQEFDAEILARADMIVAVQDIKIATAAYRARR